MYIAKHTLAIIALITASVLWGAAGPFLKWSLDETSPLTLSFFRFAIATLVILPFVIKKIAIRSEDVYKLFILSLFCVSLHITFYNVGLNFAPSINLPIIASSMPIFLILGGFLFLHEKPKIKTLIGTAISLIGVIIIVIQPLLSADNSASLLGNLFFIASTLTFVVYTILLKRFDLDYPFPVLLFWLFFMGSLTIFPFYLIELFTTPNAGIIGFKSIFGISYGAIISSLICYFLYSYGAKHTKSEETGIFIFIQPIVTALIAIPLLGEFITFTYLLGSVFVFTGIIIAEVKLHPHHPMHLVKKEDTSPIIESGP